MSDKWASVLHIIKLNIWLNLYKLKNTELNETVDFNKINNSFT